MNIKGQWLWQTSLYSICEDSIHLFFFALKYYSLPDSMCVFMCLCFCLCVVLCACVGVCMCLYMCTCLYAYVYICVHVWIYEHVLVCAYVCVCVLMNSETCLEVNWPCTTKKVHTKACLMSIFFFVLSEPLTVFPGESLHQCPAG